MGLLTQWVVLARLTWFEYSWDVIEPITWFTGMGNSILAYTFFIVFRKDFSCENLSFLTVSRYFLFFCAYGWDEIIL